MPDESEDARDCKRCRTLIVFGGDAVPRHRPDDLITVPSVAQLHPITWISCGARHSHSVKKKIPVQSPTCELDVRDGVGSRR